MYLNFWLIYKLGCVFRYRGLKKYQIKVKICLKRSLSHIVLVTKGWAKYSNRIGLNLDFSHVKFFFLSVPDALESYLSHKMYHSFSWKLNIESVSIRINKLDLIKKVNSTSVSIKMNKHRIQWENQKVSVNETPCSSYVTAKPLFLKLEDLHFGSHNKKVPNIRLED